MALVLVAALGGAGCIPVTDFNPVGAAASVSGTWTIDGEPATAESCAELLRPFTQEGATPAVPRVSVTFLDGERAVRHGSLFFDCATGAFDTGASRVVAEGDWTIRLDAIDANGRTVAVGPVGMYTARAEGAIVLDETPFLSAIISATVVIDGAPPTHDACEALGIASIQLVFDEEGGEIATRQLERCTAGGIGTRVAPGGAYMVRLRALDSTNQPIGETEAEMFTMDPGEHAALGAIELTDL